MLPHGEVDRCEVRILWYSHSVNIQKLAGSYQTFYYVGMDLNTYFDVIREDVTTRFLRYVRIHTTSDRHSTHAPSTERQFDLARVLQQELLDLGIPEVELTEHCYVLARLPATPGVEAEPVALLAHMDTAPDLSGESVNPQLHQNYDGSVIDLGHGYSLDPRDYPALRDYLGETIITTDGSTLLGADDKAGVAEIMGALRFLVDHPEFSHGEIEVVFTPDEEIGRGVDKLPMEWFHSKFGFTLDGSREGSIEAECFSAWSARVTIEGYVIHPGSAKNRLVNAVSLAGKFLSALPGAETPEATDGRDGFYCPVEVRGDYGQAVIDLIIRDFDRNEVQRRIGVLEQIARSLEAAYPRARIEVTSQQQYLNMFDRISEHPFLIELLQAAVRATGLEPVMEPIRGGTDGARLTEMGLPTPNLFAGGHNFHGRFEWIAVPALVRATATILNLVKLWVEKGQ